MELLDSVLYEHKCKDSSSGYSHNGKYVLIREVRCKDRVTGEWYDAVEYKDVNKKDIYVREKQDFIDKFTLC